MTVVVSAPQGGVPFVDEDRTPSSSALIFLQQLRNAVVSGSGSGSGGGTSGIGGQVVTNFGADSTGAIDSTAAIQNAINALPSTGGFVYFPPGIYKISSTLIVGNGSAIANSTINGISLIGLGGVSDPGLTAPNFAGSVILRWNGGSNSMVQFLGPMAGWGVQNIVFDGTTLASPSVGLEVKSAANGYCCNLTFAGCSTAGILSWTWSPISGSVTFADSIQNTYINTYVLVPAVSNAKGILLDSGLQVAGTPQSDTDYNTFINTDVFQPNSATTTYGIYLKTCDSNCFINTHMVGSGAGNVGVAFDYSIDNVFPNSNFFFMIDNASATQWSNVSTPSANRILMNKVFGIAAGNGGAFPQLANLAVVDQLEIGYNTPNSALGGSVIQITSIGTAVTLNNICGKITTVSNAWTSGTGVQFLCNNNTVGETDLIIINQANGGGATAAAYEIFAQPSAGGGSFVVSVIPHVTETKAISMNFAVFKGTVT